MILRVKLFQNLRAKICRLKHNQTFSKSCFTASSRISLSLIISGCIVRHTKQETLLSTKCKRINYSHIYLQYVLREAAKITGLWDSAPLFRDISSKDMEKFILKVSLFLIKFITTDLFSLGGLFSHCRPLSETLQNSFKFINSHM